MAETVLEIPMVPEGVQVPAVHETPARVVARPPCAYRESCGCQMPQCLHPLWGPAFGAPERREGLAGPLPTLYRVSHAACVECGGGERLPPAAVKPWESLAWLKRTPEADHARYLDPEPSAPLDGPPVFGWMHLAVMGCWERVARELFSQVERGGLLGATSRVFAGVVGPEADLSWFPPWVEVVQRDGDLAMGENSTLQGLWAWSKTAGPGRVWYAHTKGASHPGNANVTAWRDYLAFFNVLRWRDCAAALDAGYDLAGVDWVADADRAERFADLWLARDTLRPGSAGFPGNFWWATTGYLAGLGPPPALDRWWSEWQFVGSGSPRVRSFHDARKNHYREAYPRSAYDPGGGA